jgi:hypothetical protein
VKEDQGAENEGESHDMQGAENARRRLRSEGFRSNSR